MWTAECSQERQPATVIVREKVMMRENEDGRCVLIASTVYALMNHRYHVSRNVRTQWFFKNLNKKIALKPPDPKNDDEIVILSICPQDPPPEWNSDAIHSYLYLITPATNVLYLSKVNKAVYCIDMSPSISAVDIQHGEVMLDEITSALKESIQGIVTPFLVPGSDYLISPDLFVTVIVHTPFYITPAQQVLVQGWRVSSSKVDDFMSAIVKQLEILEDTIANVSGRVHDEIDIFRHKQAESERLVGGLFEELSVKLYGSSSTSMVSPDSGFINLLRYGMLALRLLPQTNLSNLIVLTDGMITLPDIHVLDSVLSQLRNNAVAVSFLHVGSQFHPHSCQGLVPYTELMIFIASATLGAYIPSPLSIVKRDTYNVYQESFIAWSFRKKRMLQELSLPLIKHNDWSLCNPSFYGNREPHLLNKKQCDEQLTASLTSVLCCRLHEGYIIKTVNLRDNDLEVSMLLPWSNHIYIEYIIKSEWPSSSSKCTVHYIVCIKAPYEFLHDITCLMKKPFHSPYRQAVVSRSWSTLKTLSQTDLLLSHLGSFSENSISYTIPESIRNGMPLFYLSSTSGPPELSSIGTSCPQFAQFWKPIVMLEPSVWQKWLHTHRIGLVLQPDRPLPTTLHTIPSSPRIYSLQCRQAEAALYCLLKKLTTFVLIENHSYIKLMPCFNNDIGPNWFYIVRLTSKPPCAVIHIAFLGGTPGNLRHQVVESIKDNIRLLKIPQRTDAVRKYEGSGEIHLRSEVECCSIINKPLEKVLIRYERMPTEFGTVVFPDGTQPECASRPLRPSTNLITTLSRYLHHKRSIWDAHTPSASHNNMLPTMISTLTRMRLQEGFRFAHCSSGITNMVLEVEMKNQDEDPGCENFARVQTCILQYVLFPPHKPNMSLKESTSGDENQDEVDDGGRTELITECWIEPQHGTVVGSPHSRSYMENLFYHQIADMVWRVDAECISNLLTFDHLQLMCHNQQIVPPLVLDPSSLRHNPLKNWPHAVAIEDKRIHRIPFAYNLMNLLPKCQQAELLSPMFIQGLAEDLDFKNKSDAPNKLLMDSLLAQLHELHHRELRLSDHESAQLVELITQRHRDRSKHPIPFPIISKPDVTPKTSDTDSTDTGSGESDWSRLIPWVTYSPSAASPPGSCDEKKDESASKQKLIPKWRCFVKSMSSTHCVLTFVPDSYQDLKILLLGSDPKMYEPYEPQSDLNSEVLEDPLCFPNAPFEEFNQTTSHDISFKSKSSSRLEIDSRHSDLDLVFDASYPHMKDKFDQPFRVRSSSWDPMKKHTDLNRYRTNSVGAKMKPAVINKQVIETVGDTSEKKPSSQIKMFYGSLKLPIYVYDCPLSSLVDALIFKSGGERRPDLFQSAKGDFESPRKETRASSGSDEVDLFHHCRVLSQAFRKCFVMALFKSLHLDHRVTKTDIQKAVSECQEFLLEIDITKYTQTICGHLRELLNDGYSPEKSLSPFSSSCIPNELLPLHKLIKKRFLEILTVCFKAVKTHQEYFFCCPPVQISRANDVSMFASSHRVVDYPDFDAVTLQSDNTDLNSHHTSMTGLRTARTSLLSNFDSDSVSDYMNDIGDDLVPLFLHLVCSLRSSLKSQKISRPIKILPTCLGELMADIDSEGISENEITSITITLDLHCLTLPSAYPADLPPNDASHDSAGSLSDHTLTLPNDLFNTDVKPSNNLQHLPPHQNKAVNKCVTEIEWFLHDEIATFLLDSLPVTETILSFVVNHVSNSDGRYSCVYNSVALNFVYGPEHSLDKFIQEFSMLKLQGHCLKKLDDYYYLAKTSDSATQENVSRSCSRCLHSEWCTHCPSWEDDHFKFIKKNFTKLRCDWSDLDCKSYYINKNYKWIQELNAFRKDMPNFWLILKIETDKVISYFHCRFLDINCEEVQRYKEIHINVLEIIENICKTVNQTLLLNSLHETRMCDPLLEPETNGDGWKPQASYLTHEASDVDTAGSYSDAVLKFPPGWFSCPVVWQTDFLLHPRLKTGPGKPGLSRAIQALRTVLNRFSVNNRTNMFVYQDCTGNRVFYLRLHESVDNGNRNGGLEGESSPGTVSRSSSINSLTNKKQQDEPQKDMRPRLKSFSETTESCHSGGKSDDVLTLQVHGTSEAGAEVTNELVQVLQNRLDDAVLEVVAVMLARNSMCKLTPDDVHFIQKPGQKADHMIRFLIPSFAYQSLDALSFYLKQNSLHSLFLPKYTDTKYIFKDYSHPEGSPRRIPKNAIYLYNQSSGSGNKGIACIALALIDKSGNLVYGPSSPKQLSVQIPRDELPYNLNAFDNVTPIESEEPATRGGVVVEARIWKQGRVNVDILLQKLKNIVQYSLWDLVTEYKLATAIRRESDWNNEDENDELPSSEFCDTIPSWMLHGYEMTVPSIKMHTIDIDMRHCVSVTLKEVNSLVMELEGTSYVFCEKRDRTGVICWENEMEIPSGITKCFVVARKFSCDSGTDETPDNCVTSEKSAASFCPRQRFLIAVVTHQKVSVYLYNWSKDRIEHMSKLLGQLGVWLNARASFISGMVLQKMGVFHCPPVSKNPLFQYFCGREGNLSVAADSNFTEMYKITCKLHLKMPAIDVAELESLMTFTEGFNPRKVSPSVSSNVTQIFRDVEPVPPSKKFDPVAACVQQITSVRVIDRKSIPDKLQSLSENRGVAPFLNVPDDTLEVFLKNSRIMHSCAMPLLFHPRWRLFIMSRRETLCDNNIKFSEPEIDPDYSWHQPWCLNLLKDYQEYMLPFGFTPVQITRTQRKMGKDIFPESEDDTRVFLHKSSFGGIIIAEIVLSPPYISVKLHSYENSPADAGDRNKKWLRGDVAKFLNECNKIKNLLQLEAFIYDYHLRNIERYLEGKPTFLPQYYHVTDFLDDFIKFYDCPPRYAPSLASCGSLSISKLSTPAQQLFLYLLSHEADYGMEVLCITAIDLSESNKIIEDNEYVLFKQKTVQFGNDSEKEDVTISVIVSFDKASSKTSITLNYFVLLNTTGDFCVKRETRPRDPSTAEHCIYFTNLEEALKEKAHAEFRTLYNKASKGKPREKKRLKQPRVERTIQEEILEEAMSTESAEVRDHVENMINRGSVDCRIHLLWNKLLSNNSGTSLTLSELHELKDLAHVQKLTDLDCRLEPLLQQPLAWYQSLMKNLMMKYTPEKYKLFVTPDNNCHQLLILHPRFLDGFVMLTVDSMTNDWDFEVVLRFSSVVNKKDVAYDDLYNLIESVVNMCCSHLWVTLLNN